MCLAEGWKQSNPNTIVTHGTTAQKDANIHLGGDRKGKNGGGALRRRQRVAKR